MDGSVPPARRSLAPAALLEVLDVIPGPALAVDETGRIAAINDDLVALLGFPEAELVGEPVERLLLEPARAEHLVELDRFLVRPERRAMAAQRELAVQTRSGGAVDLLIALSPYASPDGERFVIAALRDVSDLRAAQQACAVAEQRYRKLLERASDGILLLGADGTILEVNRRLEELAGTPREQMIGKSYLELLVPEERAGSEERFRTLFAAGETPSVERDFQLVGDRRVAVEISVSRFDLGGDPVALVMVRDNAQRRRERIELESSERRFRALFERNPAGIFRSTPEGRLLSCNQAFARLLGYSTPEEVVARPAEELYFAAEDRARFLAELEARGMVENFEGRLRRRDGSQVRVLEASALLDEPEVGRVIQGAIVDVTPLDEAWRAVAASEQRFRELFDQNPAGVFRATLDGTLIECNRAFAQIFGYPSPEELPSRRWHELFAEPATRERLVELLRARGEVSGYEIRGRRRDGSDCWIRLTARAGRSSRIDTEFFEGTILDVTAEHEAERRILETELQYRALVESVRGVVWRADVRSLQFTYVSPGAEALLGYPPAEWGAPGFWKERIHPDDRRAALDFCLLETKAGRDHQLEYRMVRRDGGVVWVHDTASVIVEAGETVALVGVLIDVSERRNLAEQLRQAQKMEAIGRLAGGVAHDFNNLMGVVLGYTEMMLAERTGEHPDRERLELVQQAADRAVALTRQLLAFSRKQVVNPKALDLNALIGELGALLRRLLGDNVAVVTELGTELWPVRFDRVQLEQVLLNLAVNARDAMPEGGRLELATSNVDLDDTFTATHPGLRPGRFVRLTVADTGMGIAAEHLAHVFEPFFTTKEAGHGTGLGLATVYGIVKQMGGVVDVRSRVGEGTEFTLLLPRSNEAPSETPPPALTALATPIAASILVVDDSDPLRRLLAQQLASAGHRVLEASSPTMALELAARPGVAIDLLLTDVELPGMAGPELARRLGELVAGVRVLFMSGYSEQVLARRAVSRFDFLQKPFSAATLIARVRDALVAAPGDR